jgi:ribosomal-protein-alanine N-acetyltransferase
MRPEHLERVLEIEARSFPTPWPAEAFLDDLHDEPWAHTLVLLDEERPEAGPRGYVCFWTLEGELSIQNIATHPDDRRLGGASRMVAEAFAEGARAGCKWAWLEVRPTNGAAIDLYAKWGFQPVARRRGYYQDTGEDAIVMCAKVTADAGIFLKGSGNR